VSHGVIVGPVVVVTAERLVLGDGTEFAISGPIVSANICTGATVKMVYRVVDGSRIPVRVSLLSDRGGLWPLASPDAAPTPGGE
jgi:hypothetical protein